jgi:hypothetical protein
LPQREDVGLTRAARVCDQSRRVGATSGGHLTRGPGLAGGGLVGECQASTAPAKNPPRAESSATPSRCATSSRTDQAGQAETTVARPLAVQCLDECEHAAKAVLVRRGQPQRRERPGAKTSAKVARRVNVSRNACAATGVGGQPGVPRAGALVGEPDRWTMPG